MRRRRMLALPLLGALPALAFANPDSRGPMAVRRDRPDGRPVFLRCEGRTLDVEYRRLPSPRLRVIERASGRAIFSADVRPLSILWLQPEERYIVGLDQSLQRGYEVILEDSVQVLSTQGRLVLDRAIVPAAPAAPDAALTIPRVPQVAIHEGPDGATVIVEGTDRQLHAFALDGGKT